MILFIIFTFLWGFKFYDMFGFFFINLNLSKSFFPKIIKFNIITEYTVLVENHVTIINLEHDGLFINERC